MKDTANTTRPLEESLFDLKLPWDTDQKPDYITPMGIKLWLDRDTTKYARVTGHPATTQIFFALEPDGTKVRVVVVAGKPVYANQSLEAVSIHLDLIKFLEDTDGKTELAGWIVA